MLFMKSLDVDTNMLHNDDILSNNKLRIFGKFTLCHACSVFLLLAALSTSINLVGVV